MNLIYEILDNPQPNTSRWSRRGVGLRLPASIKAREVGSRFGRATLLRLSTSGMRLASSIRLRPGSLLLVKVGRWGTDQFSFPCKVLDVRAIDGSFELVLGFNGRPLRVRYGAE